MTAVHAADATDVSLPARRRRTKPRVAAQGGGLRHWRHRERENTIRLRARTRGPWAIHLPATFCGASSTGARIGCGASLARPTVPMSVGQERGTWNPPSRFGDPHGGRSGESGLVHAVPRPPDQTRPFSLHAYRSTQYF